MSNLDGAKREIQRLRRKLAQEDRDFKASAPPLDADGLPVWDGESLTVESYNRLLGDTSDTELTAEELEARERLSPYAAVFAKMEREAESKAREADMS